MRIAADTLTLIRSEFGEFDLSQVCGGDNDVNVLASDGSEIEFEG